MSETTEKMFLTELATKFVFGLTDESSFRSRFRELFREHLDSRCHEIEWQLVDWECGITTEEQMKKNIFNIVSVKLFSGSITLKYSTWAPS